MHVKEGRGAPYAIFGELLADPTLSPQAKLVLMVLNGPCGSGGPSDKAEIARRCAVPLKRIDRCLVELDINSQEELEEFVDRSDGV
ncbi:MAG: hypothetical protein AAB074_18020 [Planctomycetota bacterium]